MSRFLWANQGLAYGRIPVRRMADGSGQAQGGRRTMCVHVGNTERGWRDRHEKDQFVRQIFLIFGNATCFLIISS